MRRGQWLQKQLPGAVWIAVENALRWPYRHRLERLQALGHTLRFCPLCSGGAGVYAPSEGHAAWYTLTAFVWQTLTSLGRSASADSEQHLRLHVERLAKNCMPLALLASHMQSRTIHFP